MSVSHDLSVRDGSRAVGDLVVVLLLVMAWMVTDHYLPWTAFHSEVLAATAGLVAVLVTWRRDQWRSLSPAVAFLFIAALLPWAQLAGRVLSFSGDATLVSLYLVGTGLCLWAGEAADERRCEQVLEAVAAALLIAAILTVGVTLYQWFGLSGLNQIYVAEGELGRRARGNLGQPNHVATLLCMGLAAVVVGRSRGWMGNAVAMLAAAYLAIGLAVTQSRVPWLALLLLSAWMLSRRRALFRPLRLAPTVVLAWVAWYALMFWATNTFADRLFDLAPVTSDASRIGVGRRPVLWGQWLAALGQAPWVGYGWQQGHMAQAAVALAHPGIESSDYAHSLLLDLLAWNGIPIGMALLGGLLWWYWRAGRRAEGAEDWFRLAAVTFLLAHAFVEYPHAYAYFLVPVSLLAGPLSPSNAGTRRGYAWSRRLLAAVALACLAGIVAVVHDYLLVEPNFRELREQNARIGGLYRTRPLEHLWVLDEMEAFSRAARVQPAAGMPQGELQELLTVTRRFPSIGLLQNSALALALNDRLPEAQATMQLLCALNGDLYYDIVVARLRQLTEEGQTGALPFVESLGRPEGTLADNRHSTCLKR